MSEEHQIHEELEPLLSAVLEGTLTSEQVARLETLLHGHPAQREFYVRFLMTHALLRWPYAASGMPSDETADSAKDSATGARPAPAAPSQATDEGLGSRPMNPPMQLGFIGGFGGLVRSYPVVFGFCVLLALGAGIEIAKVFSTGSPRYDSQSNAPAQSVVETRHDAANPMAAIARITGAVNCRWSNASPVVEIGDSVEVGQSLNLLSGVAEISFDIGARVILQSPARFSVDSAKSIRLQTGKLTAEITTPEARGFTVLTPEAAFVDQGTEFGVEVAPGGNSRIHVFKGEVDLALGNTPDSAVPTHRLLANSGARLEGDAPNVTLVEDTGESFLRSMAQAQRDQHVVAYWRFEDHPVGTLLPHTRMNTQQTRATVDSSFNGNDLFTFFESTRPNLSEDVAAAIVPQGGQRNRNCLDNTQFPGPVSTRDVYTNSAFSHASPIDIQRISPREWTIEASIKVMELGRIETFVGRDGDEVHVNTPPRLAFQLSAEGRPVIRFIDIEGRTHEAVATEFAVEPNRWYHVAAVSDGRQLQLFADSLNGDGYQLVATTQLPRDSSTALGVGKPEAVWALGRGKSHNGSPGQWFKGWIDEVRICDVALAPARFLFAERSGDNGITAGEPTADDSDGVKQSLVMNNDL